MTQRQAYILCLIAFILVCFILPPPGKYDTSFWIEWANGMRVTGLAHAYTIEGLNYNPLYLYVVRAYASLMGDPYDISRNINYLKIITLLFDFGAIALLIHWLKKNGRDFFSAFFILFNIAYLYNTLFWGQVDAIHTTFIFAACVAAYNQKLIWSVVLYLIAFNLKTQSILFLPVLGLLWLPLAKGNIKTIAKGLAILVTIQLVIILPFIFKGTVGAVWHNLVGVVDYNPYTSMRAYNFWYLVLWENTDEPRHTPDTYTYLGLTYKNWGFLLFCLASALSLLPLLFKTLVKWLKNEVFTFADAESGFLAAALVAVLFFYFPTQMHERYSHPAVLLAGVYFVLSRRWLMFVLISYAYLMNLEAVDKCWDLRNYHTLIFDARLIGLMYGVALLIGWYSLYKNYSFKADWHYLTGKARG